MSMMLTTYLASLNPLALLRSLPGACAQGLIWGLLALGVYITYKLLDFADLTVDGSMATGGAVAVMLIRAGMNPWLALVFAFLAGMAAGFITGMLHTALGIPGILASILTQIALYSINLNILGSSNQAVRQIQSRCFPPLYFRFHCNQDPHVCDLCSVLRCDCCDSLLVLRNRTGTCDPCNRL